MGDVCRLIWCLMAELCRPRASLHAEILVLRHQLNVLQRKSPKRLVFNNIDRLVFAGLFGLAPNVLDALKILKPETVVRWHRAGFRAYWRWKSRPRGGRPRASVEVRALIREMSISNALWGAPRIHGELVKLGIDVGQTTVAKYMARRRQSPSQGWQTFIRNHADGIASIDMFVVPTVSFRLLYGLLILRHARREVLWLGVTAHPNAQWIAQQLTEACGWKEPPRYLIRDRDSAYGETFIRRVGAMGIRDRPELVRLLSDPSSPVIDWTKLLEKVEFDVAVTESKTRQAAGEGGLEIVSIGKLGAKGSATVEHSAVNRIRFSVPVLLPNQVTHPH